MNLQNFSHIRENWKQSMARMLIINGILERKERDSKRMKRGSGTKNNQIWRRY